MVVAEKPAQIVTEIFSHGAGAVKRRNQEADASENGKHGKFGRMFRRNKVQPSDEALLDLGNSMEDPAEPLGGVVPSPAVLSQGDNLKIPAGFTYLGQFIDHDLTFDPTSLKERQIDPNALENFRTPALDLDSLYGGGRSVQPYLFQRRPDDPDMFTIGKTDPSKVAGSDPSLRDKPPFPNDLPRAASGLAILGDPRNDENLIVAQLHLAFMQFHNKVVAHLKAGREDETASVFEEARQIVIRHYQWIVLHDFLGRLLFPGELTRALTASETIYKNRKIPFMPIEFSMAAYRLGHSMIRQVYSYNRVFPRASLSLLFRFSGRSSNRTSLADDPVPIPSDWIIDWERMFEIRVGKQPNPSRKLDTNLAGMLFDLKNVAAPGADPADSSPKLSVRNLFRGCRAELPTGQQVARKYKLPGLTTDEIASGNAEAVVRKHGLHRRTPLWYYILKEAEVRENGERLGQVGSRIIAEVFAGLLRCDKKAYVNIDPYWKPTLPRAKDDDFTMVDLLNFVGTPNPLGDAPF